MLNIRTETVRAHAMMELGDILLQDDMRGEYLITRGLERHSGVLAKTPIANIEACIAYYRKEAIVSPNKSDVSTNPNDPADTRQNQDLFGLVRKHQEKFVQQQRKQQEKIWKDNVVDVYSGDTGVFSLFGCSTLLHRASDAAFVVVSVKNKAAGMQQYDPSKHTVMQVTEKRVLSADPKKKEAYQASLEAVGKDPNAVTRDVCSVQKGDDVVEVYVHDWENRGRGVFENVWVAKAQHGCVVPAHLIRAALPAAVKLKNAGGTVKDTSLFVARKMNREMMRELVVKCRVFNMCLGIFSANRPFNVRFGKREACACVYHLRGEYLSLALKQHADYLCDEGVIEEHDHAKLMMRLDDSTQFLNSIVCPREEGSKYAKPECVCSFVLPKREVVEVDPGNLKVAELREELGRRGLDTKGLKKALVDRLEGAIEGDGDSGSDDDCDGSEQEQQQKGGVSCDKCSGFTLLEEIFAPVRDHFFDSPLSELTPRAPDLRNEVPVWLTDEDSDDSHSKHTADKIVVMRHVKTYQQKKDGTASKAKEFVQRSIPLDDFWSDFLGFYPVYIVHHEVSKNQANEFDALKSFDDGTLDPVLRERHFRIVIDFLQRHALKRGVKETQQEFFAQLGITINVVSLSMHVSDAKNIPEAEKARLFAFFKSLNRPAIIRESHVYMSHDPERGQGMVQHILDDVRDYTTGDGKYAKTADACSEGRRKMWVEDTYYNGKGAGDKDSFDWGHANSDGCNADFKSASFLLYLAASSCGSWNWIWDWFCSCHGKTEECDGDGGTYKTWMEGRQLSSKVVFNSVESVVRDSRQSRAVPDRDFFKTGTGDGIYRNWYHSMPIRGVGCVRRDFPRAVDGKNLVVRDGHAGSGEQFNIGNMHRAIAQGYARVLSCSTRSCFSCAECKQGEYLKCEKSKADAEAGLPYQKGQCSHELVEVQVRAKTEVKDAYTRGRLKENAKNIFDSASEGDILAVETQSDVEPFWLVRVAEKHEKLQEAQALDMGGVKLQCAEGSAAVEVTKMMISSPYATNTFCDDTQLQPLFIPRDLIRVGDLQKVMQQKETNTGVGAKKKRTQRAPPQSTSRKRRKNNKSRAAVHTDGGGNLPEFYYDLPQKHRTRVVLKCRAADHEAEAAAENAPQAAEQPSA